MRRLRTRTHRKKGAEVVNSIMELYFNDLPPFDRHDAVLPQDEAHMPPSLPRGGVEHRMFLFTANYYMRGGIDSNTAVMLLSLVYELKPHYFDPFWVTDNLSESELRTVLVSVGLKYSKTRVPEFWLENARRLVERYKGDPGNIFNGVTSYEEACRRVRNDHSGGGFKGFQKKMVSMLVYFFMNAEFIDRFDFPIPVDIHVGRVALSCQIITVPGMPPDEDVLRLVKKREVVFDAVRDFYLWYSVTHKVDPLDLCNAMWMYSRLRCTDNPENQWDRIGKKEKNRKRKIVKAIVDWDNPATYDRWRRTCGVCAVANACKFNIGAMPYYTHGVIRLNDLRKGPPAKSLNSLGREQAVMHLGDPRRRRIKTLEERLEQLTEVKSPQSMEILTTSEVSTDQFRFDLD